jgi:hypothetical protein
VLCLLAWNIAGVSICLVTVTNEGGTAACASTDGAAPMNRQIKITILGNNFITTLVFEPAIISQNTLTISQNLIRRYGVFNPWKIQKCFDFAKHPMTPKHLQ